MGISIGQDGVLIQVPLNIPLPESLMNQIVRDWLKTHPTLLMELAAEAVTARKRELAIITDIRGKKLH